MEESNPELTAALRALTSAPTAERHLRVGWGYYGSGVLDTALEHFAAAARLEPGDGRAYEGMARVWRDWGAPHLGLGDAHRAVHYMPASPEARNTLGTILFSLGHVNEARREFEEALRLDSGAAYALDNLCYAAVSEGRAKDAVEACRRAVETGPARTGARNNLALAHAIGGELDAAARELSASGDPARAQYNLGVLLLAARRYPEAAAAFAAAARLNPMLPFVAERARQANLLAEGPDVRR
jgi:Flp pilus assembly protein TadD